MYPPGYGAPPSQPYSGPYAGQYSQPLPMVPSRPSEPFMPGIFGVNPEPSAAPPTTPLQAALQRNVSGGWAFNLWFTAVLGAVAATVVGLILTAVVGVLWGNLVKSALASTSSATDIFGGATSSFLQPDLLKLFAIEHHVPLAIQFSASALGTSASGSGALSLPLMGLLLVPAIALTLGGYISAASDYTRVARFSIARGALIAPFYGVICFILATMGSSSLSGQSSGFGGAASLGPAPVPAFFYGLLWGAIFGALGGWIQLSGRHWLAGALPTLKAARNLLPGAAIAGAVVALISGILMFVALTCAALAWANVQSAASAAGSSSAGATPLGGQGGLGAVLTVILVLGPTVAIWAFALATGASLDTNQAGPGVSAASQHTSLGFIGAQQALTSQSQLWLLIVLVPVICYLVGGRVAARIAGANTTSAGAKAGALMAVPLSILLTLLAMATSLSFSLSFAGDESATVGPSIGGTFLASLIFGAVVGGLGGASLATMPALGHVPRWLLAPFRPLGRPLFTLLDRLTRRAPGTPLTTARSWFYDGVLAAVILGILTIAANIVTAVAAQSMPPGLMTTITEWLAAALVGIPLLLCVGALVTAFTTPPPVPAFAAAPPLVPVGVPAAQGNPALTPGALPPMAPPMGATPPTEPPTSGDTRAE